MRPDFVFGLVMAVGAIVQPAGAHGLVANHAIRSQYATQNSMNIDHCAQHLRSRRRDIPKAHSFLTRAHNDLPQLLNTSHQPHDNSNLTLYTDPQVLFDSDTFHSCVLTPEVTEGPFYIEGEYLRQDVWEDQPGVPLYLDIQILDTSTCEPIPSGVFVEIWSANAIGQYGSTNETFLRGLQTTDVNGSMSFGTMFPGHYSGRTNHLHVMAHLNATVLPNSTVYSNTATHCGQIFFDEDLNNRVEAYDPYAKNPWARTTNGEDYYLAEEADNGSDPFVEWTWLDEYGVLAWIILVVNMSNVREVSVSGFHL